MILVHFHDDWVSSPGQLLYRLDRSLILKFESNLCIYRGDDRNRIRNSLFAWAFWKFIKRLRRFEELVQKRVEFAVYIGRRHVANIARLAKYSDRIHDAAAGLAAAQLV